jgi:hypothetical protein
VISRLPFDVVVELFEIPQHELEVVSDVVSEHLVHDGEMFVPLSELLFRAVVADALSNSVQQKSELAVLDDRFLGEVVGRAAFDRPAGDVFVPLSSQDDKGKVAVLAPDGVQKLQPVRIGHQIVANDTVDFVRRDHLDRGLRIVTGRRSEIRTVTEFTDEHVREELAVVDYQYGHVVDAVVFNCHPGCVFSVEGL